MSTLCPLAQALVVRDIAGHGHAREAYGAALATLRHDASIGVHDDHPAAAEAGAIRARIMALTVDDMPAPPGLVGVLVETLALRTGKSHASAWRSIGVRADTGRAYLSGRSRVEWPLWYTLREAALAE